MTCIEHRKKTKVLDLLSKVCPLLLDGGTAIGKRKRDVRFTIVAERKQGKIKFCWTVEGSEIHHCSVHGRTSRSTRPSLDPCVLADAAVRAPACPKENPTPLHLGSTSTTASRTQVVVSPVTTPSRQRARRLQHGACDPSGHEPGGLVVAARHGEGTE